MTIMDTIIAGAMRVAMWLAEMLTLGEPHVVARDADGGIATPQLARGDAR